MKVKALRENTYVKTDEFGQVLIKELTILNDNEAVIKFINKNSHKQSTVLWEKGGKANFHQ